MLGSANAKLWVGHGMSNGIPVPGRSAFGAPGCVASRKGMNCMLVVTRSGSREWLSRFAVALALL